MSTFIGRDNKGRGTLHVTSREHSEADMKTGVLESTLFHTDIPFIRTNDSYNATLKVREPWDKKFNAAAIEVWQFPPAMISKIRAGYLFIGIATLSSGATMMINADKFCTSASIRRGTGTSASSIAYLYGHRLPASELQSNQGRQESLRFAYTNNTNIVQYHDFNEVPRKSAAFQKWYAKSTNQSYLASGYSFGHIKYPVDYGVDYSLEPNTPYISKNTTGLVVYRSRDFKPDATSTFQCNFSEKGHSTEVPTVTGIKFYALDIKATTSGYQPIPLTTGSSREVKIDNTSILINKVDYLSDLQYIVFRGTYSDGATTIPVFPGSTPIAANLQASSSVISGYPVGQLPSYNEVYNYNTVGPRTPVACMKGEKANSYSYGIFLSDYSSIASLNMNSTFSLTNNILSSYKCSVYEIVKLPKIRSVEFTPDSLKLNGNVTLYSKTHQPLACISKEYHLNLVAQNRTIQAGTPSSVLEDSVSLGSEMTSRGAAHLLWGLSKLTTGSAAYVKWSALPDKVSTSVPSNMLNIADQSPNLMAIEDGKYVNIGAHLIDCSWGHSGIAEKTNVTVTYSLRKNGSKLELWSHAKLINSHPSYNRSVVYKIPALSISAVRLVSNV